MGASVGTALGGYVTKKGGALRAAVARVESDTVKRCLRAVLLGTDYSGNKPKRPGVERRRSRRR